MHYKLIHNSTSNKKGNIWMFWSSNITTPSVVSISAQAITVDVGGSLVTDVHIACLTIDRRELWEELEFLSTYNKPWMVIGDFNTIMCAEEKHGGRNPLTISMNEFHNCLHACGLMQAFKTGIEFSWCNNRAGSKRIVCNLDRAVFNTKWLEKYPGWSYKVGTSGTSDHSNLLGANTVIPKTANVPFRALRVWLSHPDFLKLIQDTWEVEVFGNPAFIFLNKLKHLKQIINDWNLNIFGDVRVQLLNAEKEVEQAALNSDRVPDNIELLNKLVTTRGKQEILEQRNKEIAQQKSRVQWLKEGASNSNFFHTSIKIRQAHNAITELESLDGSIVSTQQEISKNLVEYFENKFKKQDVTFAENIFANIPMVITAKDNMMLNATPSNEEIKSAVFEMDPDSAPGPNGFSGWFYRSAWHIIEKDFIEAIQYCWSRKFIPKGMNENFLTLIPKVQGSKKANQFRLIGLSNFCFKVITKIITTRMGCVVEKVVSPQQGAFIKGRNIQHQIVLASELINEMQTTRRGGNVGLKLDITQAYDSISWDFLFHDMITFGFSYQLIQWLTVLFQSTRISVMVNGGPADKRNIEKMLKILKDYQVSSGLIVSLEKNKCFVGGTSDNRKMQIASLCGMFLSHFPDKYLTVNLVPGKIKSSHVWGCVDQIQSKIPGWMGRMLSFQEMLILVKHVLCSMPIYNMSVYKWPRKVLTECDRIIRNFLWSGDP
ncbi:uncharacterized protein LOC113359966 [Papaver somniferum]|uniref:uncharacterized protein LOC113359966 n=1 Tax=Papaver somniferum TaxID=3469 RepID=UPI000E6F5781|nr:uncharacterized protein LOC113359966 [Papaver somniferum]